VQATYAVQIRVYPTRVYVLIAAAHLTQAHLPCANKNCSACTAVHFTKTHVANAVAHLAQAHVPCANKDCSALYTSTRTKCCSTSGQAHVPCTIRNCSACTAVHFTQAHVSNAAAHLTQAHVPNAVKHLRAARWQCGGWKMLGACGSLAAASAAAVLCLWALAL